MGFGFLVLKFGMKMSFIVASFGFRNLSLEVCLRSLGNDVFNKFLIGIL